MRRLSGWYSRLPLRGKLALVFIFLVAANTAASLYYSRQLRELTDFSVRTQAVYYQVNALAASVSAMSGQVGSYLEQASPQTYTAYYKTREAVKEQVAALPLPETADVEAEYLTRAIRNGAKTSIRDCNHLFYLVNAGDESAWLTCYEAQQKLEYLAGYTSQYLTLLLTDNAASQEALSLQAAQADLLNKLFLAGSALFSLLLTAVIAGRITRPITQLANAAEKISRGDFDVPDVQAATEDEVGRLTRSFNLMRISVEASIDHLNRRAELEAKLHQQELENLRMSQLLHEAQYLALQSQINPHFLFNTLNVIARSAVRDTPKTTTTLIYSLADLFRYNLNHLNDFTTLREELAIVEKYIYIQKARFRERIQYQATGQLEECAEVGVPSMLLQPLVENAIIHGIEDLECGGCIRIHVRRRGGRLLLRVYDNGAGIDHATLDSVRAKCRPVGTGHTTGIGLVNIISRVELIPGASIHVDSDGRRGTMVSIRLPLESPPL